MNVAASIDEFIPRIYDGVVNPGAWPAILDEFALHMHARAAQLYAGFVDEEGLQLNAKSSALSDIDSSAAIANALAQARPLLELVPQLAGGTRFLQGSELMERLRAEGQPTQWLEELRNLLADGYGMPKRLQAPLNQRSGYFDGILLHYPEMSSRALGEKAAIGNRVLPHFAQAVSLSQTVTVLQQRSQALISAVNELSFPVLILGRRRELWVANAAARDIISRHDALCLNARNQLCGCHERSIRQLDEILDALELGHGAPKDPVILARSPLPTSGKARGPADSYLACVKPLHSGGGHNAQWIATLIVLADPQGMTDTGSRGVGDLYRLTPSELSVLEMLARGFSNARIAEARQVSRETVNSQVKSLFNKMNASSRGEIIHLVQRVNLPLRSP